MNKHRRSILKFGTAAAALAVVGAWPARLLAKFSRPEAAFKAEKLDPTFEALGGTPENSDKIGLQAPEIAQDGAVVPVTVTSELPNTEEIYVLVEKNPNPLSCGFMIPEGTEPQVQTRIKVAETCDVYAVVRADGKLYQTAKEVKVTLGGCGG